MRGGYLMRSDIIPGGVFPDYALPDHTGTVRSLSELQGRDPLILTLARGNYCPKEHQQHLELAANYPKVAVAYTQIATIATDDHHTLQEFRASVGAQWTFLSDPGRTVQQDLDIAEYTDPQHNPMIPHTPVLKPGLVSNAGALRMLTLTWSDDVGAVVRETAALTARPFCGNLVLTEDRHRRLDQALDAGLRIVSFFMGDPSGYVQRVHDAGGIVMH